MPLAHIQLTRSELDHAIEAVRAYNPDMDGYYHFDREELLQTLEFARDRMRAGEGE